MPRLRGSCLNLPKNKEIGNLELTGYNALFSSTVEPTTATDTHGERIVEIPLTELHPPEFHPFHVVDDEAMERLAANIGQYVVREPGLGGKIGRAHV